MALARLESHKPFAAMGKPLEPDGGKRIGDQNAAEHDGESDEWLLHFDTPMLFVKPDSSNDVGYAKARQNASEALRTDLKIKGASPGPPRWIASSLSLLAMTSLNRHCGLPSRVSVHQTKISGGVPCRGSREQTERHN